MPQGLSIPRETVDVGSPAVERRARDRSHASQETSSVLSQKFWGAVSGTPSSYRVEAHYMAQKGIPAPQSELTDDDRQVLARWSRRSKTAQALAQRARIVLAAAAGTPSAQIARDLGVGRDTIGRWRKRFVEGGVDALLDEPRCGAPRQIGDADVERVVRMTLEERPKDSTHWSTRSMASASGLSQSAIVRIWRAFGLQPHRSSTFKLSKDPQFVEGASGIRVGE